MRRKGHAPVEAQDLVQSFLARILATRGLKGVEPGHGRFRSYLKTAMRHFLANECDRARAGKRGGGVAMVSLEEMGPEDRYSQHLADDSDPETQYERAWAITVLERVHRQLRREYRDKGREDRFTMLEDHLMSESEGLTYAEIGARLGVAEGTVKAEVHRLRKRYRSLLRGEVAHTVTSPADISEELRFLIAAISR